MWRVLATLLGIGAFVGILWLGARAEQRVECNACVTFHGRTECRVGRGESERMAMTSAVTGACAVLGSGVTDSIQCNSLPPSSVECRKL